MLALNKKALAALQQAIDLNPVDHNSYNNLGSVSCTPLAAHLCPAVCGSLIAVHQVLIAGMKPRAAAAAFRNVVTLTPGHISAMYNLDHAYRQFCYWHKRRVLTRQLLKWAQRQMASGQTLTLGAYPALTYRCRSLVLTGLGR